MMMTINKKKVEEENCNKVQKKVKRKTKPEITTRANTIETDTKYDMARTRRTNIQK